MKETRRREIWSHILYTNDTVGLALGSRWDLLLMLYVQYAIWTPPMHVH